MLLPVRTRDGKGTMIDRRLVNSVERDEFYPKRDIIYYTSIGEFFHITSIDSLAESLQVLDFNMLIGGKTVNMPNIKWFDESENKVYFDEVITSKSRSVKVSARQMPIFNNYFKEHMGQIKTL